MALNSGPPLYKHFTLKLFTDGGQVRQWVNLQGEDRGQASATESCGRQQMIKGLTGYVMLQLWLREKRKGKAKDNREQTCR